METAYGGVRIADINKDGYLDMLAGGTAIDLDNPGKKVSQFIGDHQKVFFIKIVPLFIIIWQKCEAPS